MRRIVRLLIVACAASLRPPEPLTSPPRLSPLARIKKHRVWLLRIAVFLLSSRTPAVAVHTDTWTALRTPQEEIKGPKSIIARRRRAQKITQLTGIGYTPRIVALAGLMLRGLQKATNIPLDPPIGFGAGANVAAAWTHREWLPCILLGWYAGGAYWDFLGVRPPPSFTGIPITIEKTRLGIASSQKSPP